MQSKLIAVIVVLFLVATSLLVAGCTSSPSPTAPTTQATQSPSGWTGGIPTFVESTKTPQATAAPSVGGPAGGGLSFSAHQVPISADDLAYGFYSGAAAQGYTYVGFYCSLTNNGGSTYKTNIVSLKLTTTTGVYTDSPYVYQKGEFPTDDISLRNGDVVNGVALFKVPVGTTGFNSITYSDGNYNLRADL